MGGIGRNLKKLSRGANPMRPQFTFWWIACMAVGIAAALVAYQLAKGGMAQGKKVVGGVLPGSGGKEGMRDMLGI